MFSGEHEVRGNALRQLRDSPSETRQAVLPGILARFKDADPEVRARALEVFTFIPKDGEAVRGAIIELLKDPVPNVRSYAGDVLARTGLGPDAAKAVPLLIAVLKDTEDIVERVTIGGMEGERRIFKEGARRGAARALRDPGAEAAVPALLKALQEDKDEHVRGYAAGALGLWASSQPVYDALLAALKDKSPTVRSAAAWQLGEGPRRSEALEEIRKLSSDPDAEVADTARRALAEKP